MTSNRRSTSDPSNETRVAAAKDADRAERDAVDSIDYAVLAFYSAQGWLYSTRWTHAPTRTSAPRSPARKGSHPGQ